MPTPAHTRVTFSGTLGAPSSPVEKWSFGLNFRPPAAAPGAPRNTVATNCATAYTEHLLAITPPFATLTEVKVAAIQADGTYADDPGILEGSYQGTSGGIVYPYDMALVVSLVTATRGAKGRGRYYPPAPGYPLNNTDGKISATSRDTFATAHLAFLQALQEVPGLGSLVVASTSGILSDVTDIRVGRVMDVVRSRRSGIDEEYGTGIFHLGTSTS